MRETCSLRTAGCSRYPTHSLRKKANALDENKISQPPRLMRGIPLKNSLWGAEFLLPRACNGDIILAGEDAAPQCTPAASLPNELKAAQGREGIYAHGRNRERAARHRVVVLIITAS
jgi:hypothetical protein